MVHGLGRSANEWLGVARALDPDAIVPDLPELRRTDALPDVEAVIATLLAVAPARATWLAHSFGVHVTAELAIHHPGRVRRFVAVAAVLSQRTRARIPCPTLVIAGRRDVAGIADVVLDCGHDPHLECPDALLAAIRAFI